MATLKNTVINDTGYIQLASGTTAQRVGSTVGETRYNSSTGQFEGYAATGWHVLSPQNLSVTGVTPGTGVTLTPSGLEISPTVAGTFTINGFNFTPSTTVTFGSTAVTTGVTYVSPTQITVTSGTGWSGISGTYASITVTNEFGQTASLTYTLLVGAYPVFSTASNLGTVTEGSISKTIAATSAGGTVTYSASTNTSYGGSGYGLPSGLSINSSTGAITGSLTVTGTKTYNISILATDAASARAAQDFTLIVTDSATPTITSPSAGSLGTLSSYNYTMGGATYASGTGGGTGSYPAITNTLGNPLATPTGNLTSPSITTFATIVGSTVASSIVYRISSGSLPPGVVLNSTSGVISGTQILATKNAPSQTYNFGVTAVDSNGNSSSETAYSITVTTPYLYRQILSTGYVLGGYKSSTPWKNVNRLNMPTEITYSLGDALTYAFNYKQGATGPDKHYVFHSQTDGVSNSSGSATQVFNMRTESTSAGATFGTAATNNGALCLNDGFAQYAYITAGAGNVTFSASVKKYRMSDDTFVTSSITTGVQNTEGQGSSDETFGIFSLGSGTGGITATKKLLYSTETVSDYGVAVCGSTQQKALQSKLGTMYAGNAATYGDSNTADSSNFTKTYYATQEQFTVSKGYGTGNSPYFAGACGEEIFVMGQDRGWGIGIYDTVQNNNAFRFIYATDIGMRVDAATSRKATTGSSSGTGGWRD